MPVCCKQGNGKHNNNITSLSLFHFVLLPHFILQLELWWKSRYMNHVNDNLPAFDLNLIYIFEPFIDLPENENLLNLPSLWWQWYRRLGSFISTTLQVKNMKGFSLLLHQKLIRNFYYFSAHVSRRKNSEILTQHLKRF